MKRVGRKTKIQLLTGLLILAFIIGIFLLLYGPVGVFLSDKQHEQAIQEYMDAVNKMSDEEISEIFERAKAYNEELALNHRNILVPLSDDESQSYPEQLSVPGTDVIAYIEISSIDVRLPIYHYASEETMERGSGHWEVTSLPIGGSSTHSFITAHRAMASATMFAHLDKLSEGDTFTVTVLNQTLTYEVDQIQVVEAEATDELYDELIIEEGKDDCSLMTCTPYGQTTHRLLIKGHRVN